MSPELITFVDNLHPQWFFGFGDWQVYQNSCMAFDCDDVIDVTPVECRALVDLYPNTNGPNRYTHR
jgi:hypothetical protein